MEGVKRSSGAVAVGPRGGSTACLDINILLPVHFVHWCLLFLSLESPLESWSQGTELFLMGVVSFALLFLSVVGHLTVPILHTRKLRLRLLLNEKKVKGHDCP